VSEGEDQGPGEGAENGAESITERVAAILAADAVGYSRLMADDEAATVKSLDQARGVFRRHVEANRGRVVDTAGDSVLAVFETTSGAVRASMAIQEGLQELNADTPTERQMQFRIGIHLGDIMEKPSDGTIYGDGVNVAARLEALSEPGGITVSSSVHDSIRDRLEVGFEFLGEHEGKNLKRPVKAYRVLPEGEEPEKPKSKPRIPLSGVIAAGIAAIVVVAGVVWWQTQEPEPVQMADADGVRPDDPVAELPAGPAIAVLPFDNLGGDPEQAYFADGLAEDILTRLSRFTELKVIARNSSFQYKGKAIDVRTVADELGAEYVLEGSVRRTPETIRVTVQLLDARDGSHIWAETYDRDATAANVFALQDEITTRIASAIGGNFGAVAAARIRELGSQQPENLESFECVLLAYQFQRVTDAAAHLAARNCLERAVKQDPDYVDGLAWLGQMYLEEYWSDLNPREEGPPSLDAAFDVLQRAVELNPDHQKTRHALAMGHFYKRDLGQFLLESKRAIDLNPANIETVSEMAWMTAYAGDWERGMELFTRAKETTGKVPPWLYLVPFNYLYKNQQYTEALTNARPFADLGYWVYKLYMVMTYAQLGDKENALAVLADVRAEEPELNTDEIRAMYANLFWEEEHVNHLMEGVEKALKMEAEASPSRPVIAVLPFDNMSGDPEQEYFADGVTEDIITRLAQFPDLLVLGRNTTFQFKGQAVDIPTIAEKLGADYVVEGSIRRGGDTVRVSAQLLGGEEWAHVWAKTYDQALDPENIFAIQDELTEAIASRIGDPYGEVGQHEFQRSIRRSPEQLSSYECVLRYFDYVRNLSPEGHKAATACLTDVVEAEPDYSVALAFLGDLHIDDIAFGFGSSDMSSLAYGRKLIERSFRSETTDAQVQIRLARALLLTNDYEAARHEAENALRLSPNDTDIMSVASEVFNHTGAYDRSQDLITKVELLNPNYPTWMNWHPARYHFVRGEYREAIRRMEMTQMGWYYMTNAHIASAHCANGDLEEGRKYLSVALEQRPDLAEVYWPESYFWHKGPEVRPLFDVLSAGLEACGWDVPPDPGREAFAQ
jgi:adenylate cyclase